ncbi:MAG: hypothetical protein AAFR62_18940 [Cyanobacteria bacterium J06629_2]
MPAAILGKATKVLSAISPFIALAGIVILQSQEYKKSVQKLNRADYLAQEQEQARVVDWQKQSSHFGFDNLKASWSYLDFVQYFGDTKARDTIGYRLVPEYFETINSIDPRFTEAHLTLSVANSIYAGNPERTIALMEQAIEAVDPESKQAAFLWTSKGMDELLFMGDKQAAINSYKMAAKWASLTQEEGATNLQIKDLESNLEDTTEIELKEAQVRAWSSVLVYIRDNHRQREILDKIIALKADISTLKEEQAVQQ